MRGAKEGTSLATLIAEAIPVCQEAERRCPRRGAGRKPVSPDWVVALLIMVAVLKRKKSKSAQYRFIHHHRAALSKALGGAPLPRRSTYFERYRRAAGLMEMAIRIQGEWAVRDGLAQPQRVAIDKSVIAARGRRWHHQYLAERGGYPRGADRESTWTRTPHDGWIQGYAFEVVVTAQPNGVVWPLLASAHRACDREARTSLAKLRALPSATQHVMADSAYDTNDCTDAVEGSPRRPGRRFVCPIYHRGCRSKKAVPTPRRGKRLRWVKRRQERDSYVKSLQGKRLLTLRSISVEPFNARLKALFELEDTVWHRGLGNNQTQLLAAIANYQLLLRHNHRCGNNNGQIQWILDAL
ncbi:MAG: hypothetical protein JNJ77_10045 [Planctomycetia bacterium]|nr:hypothetical protein [Planctomycetia bacterium]